MTITMNDENGLQDVAASLIQDQSKSGPIEDEDFSDVEVGEDADTDDISDVEEPDETEDQDEDEDGDDYSPDEEDAEDYDDTDDVIELDDSAKFRVTVDGEEEVVSLADLKRRYAGEGAIEKRLQQATEARKVTLEQARSNRDFTQKLVSTFGELLLTPEVPKPDPQLLNDDFQEYVRQDALHRQSLEEVEKRKQALAGVMKQLNEQVEAATRDHRKQQSEILAQKLPQVKDKNFSNELLKFAKDTYGATDEELGQILDHRVFLLLADSYRLHKLLKNKNSGEPVPKKTKARTLRYSSAQAPRAHRAKQQQKAATRARQTGKVDDVAATLLVRR